MGAKTKAKKDGSAKSAKSSKSAKSTKAKRSKVKASKKSEKTEETPVVKEEPVVVEETPVVVEETPAVVPETLPESTTDTPPRAEDALATQLTTLLDSVSVIMTQLKGLQTEVKTVQKNYTKLVKEHDKTTNKRRRQYRKPSGFAKPSPLSDEMTTFLGLDQGVEIARNEVTKLINKYIVDNSLRNESDKRKILPDDKLTKLLNLTGDEELSYFNLQKYIKHHFVPKVEQTA
tara:strand:+ start:323 stop:1018 length:696 start_codon:yes stop_codon:yes gene_type:complete